MHSLNELTKSRQGSINPDAVFSISKSKKLSFMDGVIDSRLRVKEVDIS